MKKYLMSGVAAIAFLAAFTSCTKSTDLYDQGAVDERNRQEQEKKDQQKVENIQETYEQAFENAFGKPDPNHTWGFGSGSASTRSIDVNGDIYSNFNRPTDEELDAAFPGSAPKGVIENPTYDDYTNTANKNFLFKSGSVEPNYWNTNGDTKNYFIDGDVTINMDKTWDGNIIILSGNVTFEGTNQFTGFISVASGATLTFKKKEIASNSPIKVFNRGTINFTTDGIDIGNNAYFYNEGKVEAKAFTYSPAQSTNSYFINMGDNAELTANSMTINSTGNCFNSGKIIISGETKVTKDGCFWINDGYYESNTFVFSAHNEDFYNYCTLIVKGNIHFYDGEFNMMNGSYVEAATADIDNFHIYMGNNSGIYIKGNTEWGAQADSDQNKIELMAGATKAYIKLGGVATIQKHKNGMVIGSGITYAIQRYRILENGVEVTQQQLIDKSDGTVPNYVFNGTEAPIDKLSVSYTKYNCGATWEYSDYDGRVMAEDLNAQQASDFDFNDVVFDWKIEGNKVKILIKAAGGIYPLYVGSEAHEVHKELGQSAVDGKYPMINTGDGPTGTATPFYYEFTGKESLTAEDIATIPVWVVIDGVPANLDYHKGKAACKFNTSPSTRWLKEYQNISKGYPDFDNWVSTPDLDWTKNKKEEFLY